MVRVWVGQWSGCGLCIDNVVGHGVASCSGQGLGHAMVRLWVMQSWDGMSCTGRVTSHAVMGLWVIYWLDCWSCHNANLTCTYMQGLSKVAVDALVIHATKKPQSVQKAPSGFSSIGCMEYGSMQLMSMVLNVVLAGIVTQEDWHYVGRHALPICLPMFVASANRLLFNSGSPDDEELLQKNAHMRPFLNLLCESIQQTSLFHRQPGSSMTHQGCCPVGSAL